MSEQGRKNALVFVTGFIVFSTILPDHRPWNHSWGVMLVGTFGAGFFVGILSILTARAYQKLRPLVLQSADKLSPLQRELQNDEIFVIFCISLMVVSAIYLLGAAGAFEGLSASEEFSVR